MSPSDIDLEYGHTLRIASWRSDEGDPVTNDEPMFGAVIQHRRPDNGALCAGSILFDGPVQRTVAPNAKRWAVDTSNGISISPAVECKFCGDRGIVRNSKWYPD